MTTHDMSDPIRDELIHLNAGAQVLDATILIFSALRRRARLV